MDRTEQGGERGHQYLASVLGCVAATPPLQIAMNPFVAGASGSRMGRPLQTSFGEVVRQIGLQTPVVVVVGSAGTGKSLLMEITARACLAMGLSVRSIERGDLLAQAFGEKTDVLMVDQSDFMSNSSLQTLLSAGSKDTATTKVFLCLPSCVGRFTFSGLRTTVIELAPLSLSDARNYLQERAISIGRPTCSRQRHRTSSLMDRAACQERCVPWRSSHFPGRRLREHLRSKLSTSKMRCIAQQSRRQCPVAAMENTVQSNSHQRQVPTIIGDKASSSGTSGEQKGNTEALNAPLEAEKTSALAAGSSPSTPANFSPL